MNKADYTAGRVKKTVVPDKVDMSLDDIIRLNKREKQLKRKRTDVNNKAFKKNKGHLTQSKGIFQRNTEPIQRGGGAKLRSRRIPAVVGKRKGQGVITGLAAKRPVLLKRAATLNRGAFYQKPRQRSRAFTQLSEVPYRKPEVQRRLYQQPDPQRGQTTSFRPPVQLRRRTLPPAQLNQKEARQATFLFRRGLKVQTQVQKPNPYVPLAKTRSWRSPAATSSGILTVSIANPTARTQPEPASSWTLHPVPAPPAPVPLETTTEKKVPKGVALEFDINSVGKPQTSMTLNERFRILKDQRAAAQTNKAGRFVTVG